MAYVKQNWENLPSTNTPLTAERLNYMEDGIAEAWEHGEGGAGESLPVGSEIEFDGLSADIPAGWEFAEDDYNVFSTDEKQIGVWIDNKPIYRKIYEKQVSANSTDNSIYLMTALNYDTIWINQGKSFCQYGANTSSGINWYNGTSDYGLVYINPSGNLNIKNNSGNSRTYYITLEYTKSS